jgi:hypothetical protein
MPAKPAPAQGLTTSTTPANPTSTAVQRAPLMRSPRNATAPRQMNSGPLKPIAVSSASVTSGSAANHRIMPPA